MVVLRDGDGALGGGEAGGVAVEGDADVWREARDGF